MSSNINLGIGSYNSYSDNLQQSYTDTCAIKSQQLIPEANGVDVTEAELKDEAIHNGWYVPRGTPMEDVGEILGNHGMEVYRYTNATVSDIANELSQGLKLSLE